MQNLLLVAIGGAVGASTRYGIGLAAGRMLGTAFPWGTLGVNLLGCFVMGLVGQWLLDLEPQFAPQSPPLERLPPAAESAMVRASSIRHLIAIGFLGGLTTFSAFGWDTFRQFETGRPTIALANIAANLLLSLLAVWAGATLLRTVS